MSWMSTTGNGCAYMSELVVEAVRLAHRGLVQQGQVDGDTLGDVVVIPVTVTAALDGDVPLPSARKGRQGLDGLGDLLRILGLQDAPRQDLLDGETPEALEGARVPAVGARVEQQAVAETSFYECIALGEANQTLVLRCGWGFGGLYQYSRSRSQCPGRQTGQTGLQLQNSW